MKPKVELLELDGTQIGLDRTNVAQSHPQLLGYDTKEKEEDDDASVQNSCEPESRSSTRRIVDSIKDRHHDAGVKFRKTLHIPKASDNITKRELPILGSSVEEKSESRLVHKVPVPEKHTLKDFLHSPVDTVKSVGANQGGQQVAANIAAKEIPHGEEVDLVNAATAVQSAESKDERAHATQKVSKLLDERQSTYARWTLNRHVTKVRKLPRDTFIKKSREAFERKNAQGDVVTDWRVYGSHLLEYYAHQYGGQYIGYGSNPPTPSKETIMPNIERLVVATSPFQELIMTTRRVYLWESTTETMKYLVIYFLLWYFDVLLAGFLSTILYLVVERRIHGNSMEDLRADIKRREDVERTALSLTEFIEKKGDKEWADELLQNLGPWLMIQLADMANFFETVRNFYEWQNPNQSILVLCIIGGAVLGATFTPTWLLIKASTLSAGITFFGLFPISIKFLDYRLLVSPLKRLLWNIPTHAEWAIKFTQDKAARVTNEHVNSSPSSAKAYDHGFYKAYHDKTLGHLILSTDSVHFVSNIGHTVHFILPYIDIQALEKQDRIVAKTLPSIGATDSGKDMKLVVTKTGKEWMLKDVHDRDEAFSQIIGFSKTSWQVFW